MIFLNIKSRLANDWDTYREARNNFHKLNRSKLLSFFEKKGTKDFKNSKKFWDFYKTSVKIRSDRAHSDSPTLIIENETVVTDPVELSNLFNNFFTSIGSVSMSDNDECVKFTEKLFNKLKSENELRTTKQKMNSELKTRHNIFEIGQVNTTENILNIISLGLNFIPNFNKIYLFYYYIIFTYL